jgi:arylsulfatase A-like enzyme
MRRIPLARGIVGLCLRIAFSIALAAVPVVDRPALAADGARPNILVFVTDDQRLDGLSVMPKTASWFRAGGSTFPNGVVTTPLCCPSRASIFTGRYAHNHGLKRNGEPQVVRNFDQSHTIQRYLHDAGYHTGLAGKFLNPWPSGTPPSYFDRSMVGEAYSTNNGYQTDVIGNFAEQSLNTWESSDATPWFLYLAPKAPHAPYTAQPKYATATVPPWNGPPSVFEPDRSDKPPWVRSTTDTPADAHAVRIAQSRTLMSVDDMVDRIMRRLDALGETNTLAVFISDNGYFWGEHGVVDTKRLPYLESVRVPFHVRWPGHLPAGAVDPRLVAGIDLAPTFLEAAGLPRPASPPMDGVSMLGGFTRARIHLEYYRSTDAPKWPSWAATLTPETEYVEWYDDDLQTVSFREYYDLANDPWQLTNLLADGNPGNDPNLSPWRADLAADSVCSGNGCLASTDGPTVVFSDGFESGSMSAWSQVIRVAVQTSVVRTGTRAARGTATGQPVYARKTLGSTPRSAGLGAEVRVLSHTASSAVILLRVVASNGVGLARLLLLPDGRLAYRNDVANVQRTSTTTLTGAWHRLELRVTGGTSGSVQVLLDGAVVSGLNRGENLGTAPVGSVEIGDHVTGRTYDIAWDDVLVTTPA